VDPARKEACRLDLKLYLETYHREIFELEWSPDHERIIKKIQTAVLIGGLQAIAMPRGSGKSAILSRAVLWAVLYGHHKFAVLVCANQTKAGEALEELELELETNEQLAGDFPEICYPIQCLERIVSRQRGQTCDGRSTYLTWTGSRRVLPTIEGSAASGAVLLVAGIHEAIRGAKFFHPQSRRIVRPSLALIDDPQTDESAKSDDQCESLEKIITAGILGMAGPDKSFAALGAFTVIEPGDVADRILNREEHPEWRGERIKLLESFPKRMDLWAEYYEIFRRCLAATDDGEDSNDAAKIFAPATRFYAQRREEMDEGAKVSWESRKLPHHLSALQNAMHLFFRNELAFWSEYQNDPRTDVDDEEDFLEAQEIAAKLSGYERLVVPKGCEFLTAFIDCHKRILFWKIYAWRPNFDGFCIDYGTYPAQKHPRFTSRRASPTLQSVLAAEGKNVGAEAALFAGLERTAASLFKPYKREDGAELHLNVLGIDGGWNTVTVEEYCRTSKFAGRVLPTIGMKRGPNQMPVNLFRKKPHEVKGDSWILTKREESPVRRLKFDTYIWKTFFHRRLATAKGDPGSLSFFGRGRTRHEFLARHLTSEFRKKVKGDYEVDVWENRPGETENHWFDCGVGNAMLASTCGANLLPRPMAPKPKKPVKREPLYG